ncbi:MAG: DUF2851 family protein [Endomicrobiia bacterium]
MKKETYIKLRSQNKVSPNRILDANNDFVPSFSEKMIRDIWYKHGFDNNLLVTLTGKKIMVVSPGEYNHSDGPDFINAKVIISGKELSGDVEIHVRKSDWLKHRHYENVKYKNVVLHVFYEEDIGKINYDIEELCLKDRLKKDFYDKLDIVNNKYIYKLENLCGKNLSHKDYVYLEEILYAAAEVRLNIKSEQFALWFYNKIREEQLLYERILEVFGYMNNRENFLLLSRILSLQKIRKITKTYPSSEQKKVVETLFFGVSGFFDKMEDDDTKDYLLKLKQFWDKELKVHFNKIIDKTKWNYYKTIPISHPVRKIFAASKFVTKFLNIHLNQLILNIATTQTEEEILKHYCNIFYQEGEGFFATRSTFASKEFKTKIPLFSLEKVYIMLINVIFPYLIYKSRVDKIEGLYQKVLKTYNLINYSEKNKIVKDFLNKLIIYPEYQKYFKTKLIFSQGTIQLYKDFCQPNKGECKNCKLPEIFKYKPNDSTKNIEIIKL